uniref:unconventional myosin-VIIa-like n=1 Tax=Styela clava TaxID=7725 RepID=UPI001939CF2B|nr:unconventional myosin-VIIa-like [Styela clava]
MAKFKKGDHVWLIDADPQSQCSVPLGAVVEATQGGKIKVFDDEKKKKWLKLASAKIELMHPTSVEGVEDMIRLGDLNEAGMLRNLLIRYNENKIYTYTGSILVAVNPYQVLPLYGVDQVRMYTDKKFGELPPHIFAIADNAYSHMQITQKDQCVIVSGESGAGKTESTKFILQYLTSGSRKHSPIEEQLLKANPVLEAFGNAKTVRNDNSSRFGKFIKIKFSKKGVIIGAYIEQYLVEKSRIVYQANDERNYHIFYCMLAGMSSEQKQKLGLGKPSDYSYLTRGSCLQCEGRDDKLEFEIIVGGMKDLSISEDEINQIYKLLAAILHVGNFKFEETMINNSDGACELVHSTGLKSASDLLGVNCEVFKKALTQQTRKMGNEKVTSKLSILQAQDAKDAYIKSLYSRIFIRIVSKINSVIYSREESQDKSGILSIGLLDIFGFENFENNGFEQLCINFANEKLQQFFVRHIFKLEQKEYDEEDIEWRHIEFTDNQEILNMIADQPMNVLALITEEARFPKGTDRTMLDKLISKHGKSKYFDVPKSRNDDTFGIRHFAGPVRYKTTEFLERNRDSFNADILSLIRSSKNEFLKSVFQEELNVSDLRRNQTLCEQFKKSLNNLVRDLGECQPFFVRCIKPNEFKKANNFDRLLIARQLRYSGMMDTIRIRRDCYPIRYTFKEFVERYQVILPSTVTTEDRDEMIEICNKIMDETVKDKDWKKGLDKMFLKDKHILSLEAARRNVTSQAVAEAFCKRYLQRRRYNKMTLGYARLQALWRGRRLAFRYNFARKRIIGFQAHCRGFLIRRHHRHRLWAIMRIQAGGRGMIARRQYKQLLFAREQEKLSIAKQQESERKEIEKSKLKDEEQINLSELQKNRKQSRIADYDATVVSHVQHDLDATASSVYKVSISTVYQRTEIRKDIRLGDEVGTCKLPRDKIEVKPGYYFTQELEGKKNEKRLLIELKKKLKENSDAQESDDKEENVENLAGKKQQVEIPQKVSRNKDMDETRADYPSSYTFKKFAENTLLGQGITEREEGETVQASETFLIRFPDNTSQNFEVESSTKAKDFCNTIANRLALKSAEGFSLYVNIAGNDICVPDNECFVKFVKDKTHNDSSNCQVVFIRKLWMKVTPGEDRNADIIFHYYHEVSNFLRGYHNCTREEGIQLAALIYRIKFGEDRSKFAIIPQLLENAELLPKHLITSYGDRILANKGIKYQFNKHNRMSKDDAKISFLKIVSGWPTFGARFFDVKLMTKQAYPKNLEIAINKNRISLIDPKKDKETKNILRTFSLHKIRNWNTKNEYFSITFGNIAGGGNFRFEATKSDEMHYLLSSYVDMFPNSMHEDTRL